MLEEKGSARRLPKRIGENAQEEPCVPSQELRKENARMWITHSKDLVDSIASGDSSVLEVKSYWVVRQQIEDLLAYAEGLKVSGARAHWVLEDIQDHLYSSREALFNVAVFSRTPRKGVEKIEEIQEHMQAMEDLLQRLEEQYG